MSRYVIASVLVGTAVVAASLWRTSADMQTYVPAVEQQASPVQVESQLTDSARSVELLKRAIKLQADSQHTAALAAFDSAASQLPQIAEWIALFSAASASHLGDTVEVSRRLGRAGDTLTAQWGWRARVRAFATARARQRAIEVATDAAASGSASKRGEAWFRVADLQRELGNSAAQRAALFKVLEVAPESAIGRDAALALSERSDLTVDEMLKTGRILLSGDATRGVRQLERAFAAGDVALATRAQLRFEMGRALFNAAKHEEAIKQLDRVPRTHARAAEARFLLGRAQYRAGDPAAGRRTFRSVADSYPTSSFATRSLFMLADLAHDDGQVADAASLFAKAAAAPAKVEQTAHALMRRGAIALIQDQPARAAEIFESFRSQYPSGSYNTQATYWAAQSYLRAGQNTKGNELLRDLRQASPISYYGMRAADAVGGDLVSQNLRAGPATDSTVHAAIEKEFDRWELLRDVGWNDAATYELARINRRYQNDRNARYTIAEELNERGAPNLGIAAGRELLAAGTGYDLRLMRILYPMPYRELIEREANALGLDPYFVAGLIRQESRFHNRAVSGAGAIGLMQVMPATGQQLSRKVNVGTVTRATLMEPEINIKLGTQFLADMINTYGKRLDAVLVAYNAGPTRATRWKSFPEYGNEDLFVERIPFDETRDYVKVVQLNAAVYRALYGTPRTGD